jgi:plastocyanin
MEEKTSSNKGVWITVIIIIILVIIGIWAFAMRGNNSSSVSNSTDTTGTVNTDTSATPDETGATDQGSGTGVGAGVDVNAGVTTGATKTFTVTGSNFTFTPKALSVNKGDTVKITFKNANGFHDFNIDEFNVHSSKIQGGQEETVTFVASKTGSFQYYCSVGNHRAMGMWGTLTVK